MGQVFRATDTTLKRAVAIKILAPSLAHDADRLARFQREAEVLASLNHPHIAAHLRTGRAGGVKALVMEFVQGETSRTASPGTGACRRSAAHRQADRRSRSKPPTSRGSSIAT